VIDEYGAMVEGLLAGENRKNSEINLHLSSNFISFMVLGSPQPLTELTTRKLPGGKGWPVHEADKITATCEPIV
jgi:hypothetical protein